jgi:hypothetical protein
LLTRLLTLTLIASAASPALAVYPQARDNFVNDFADVLSPGEEQRLRGPLVRLREEHGIEAVVVTVPSYRAYGTGDASIESFATGLFNTWGVGHRDRDDGALVVLAVEDHEVRIEVGEGWSRAYDDRFARIISECMIPRFKSGDLAGGLQAGVEALERELVASHPVEDLRAETSSPTRSVPAPPVSAPPPRHRSPGPATPGPAVPGELTGESTGAGLDSASRFRAEADRARALPPRVPRVAGGFGVHSPGPHPPPAFPMPRMPGPDGTAHRRGGGPVSGCRSGNGGEDRLGGLRRVALPELSSDEGRGPQPVVLLGTKVPGVRLPDRQGDIPRPLLSHLRLEWPGGAHLPLRALPVDDEGDADPGPIAAPGRRRLHLWKQLVGRRLVELLGRRVFGGRVVLRGWQLLGRRCEREVVRSQDGVGIRRTSCSTACVKRRKERHLSVARSKSIRSAKAGWSSTST